LREIVQRHEVLRTTFDSRDGEPFQVVHSRAACWFLIVDVSELPDEVREKEALRRLSEESQKPFDLHQGPLLRSFLFRLASEDHILLLAMHHIICDGWSLNVIQREMAAMYGAFSEGRTSPLAELQLQYADFAAWQRSWLQGETLEKQVSYWQTQLKGVPKAIAWPTGRPRAQSQSFRGVGSRLTLPVEKLQVIKALSRREGTTLFMTLLAAFQALLYGHTKQLDIVVGSPVANRNREEIEGLVGFFVNTLVLRTHLSEELTFRTLLAKVREICLEAYANQDVPFEMIVARLNPHRERGVAPLFQVMFSLQNQSEDTLALPGLQVTRLTSDRETSKFDLSLALFENADGLLGTLRCALDLFDPGVAQTMASQFHRLLDRIIADPDQHLSELLQSLELAGTLKPRSPSPKSLQEDSPAFGQHITRRPPTAPLELSFVQERMWFLQQLEPASPVFNRVKGLRLQGPLNVPLLSRAIHEIIGRHEILRLAVPAIDGKPVPVVAPELCENVVLQDLSGLPERQAEQQAAQLAQEEAQRPFDLAAAPLLRVRLLQIGSDDHVLLLTFHHIISDAWSDSVFWRELECLYNGFCGGKSSQLPELGIQYSDFAYWQRQMLESKRLEEHWSYWREKLSGELPVLNLALDRPRSVFLASRGARRSLELDSQFTDALKSFSRREGVTLFTTLLAAFNTLLFRYTGQEDLLVGTPVAGRTRVELEGLIGPVLRTLVLRNDASGNPTFRELLARIRQTTLEAMSSQELPFEKLLETLQPDRALSHSPIFQVLFNFRNVPKQLISLNQLSTTDFVVETTAALFDMDFEITEKNGVLQCSARYQEALFSADMVSGFLRHFRCLLEAIVPVPTQHLAEVSLLSRVEREEILGEWQGCRDLTTTSASVHEMFESRRESTPDAPAIVFESVRLTYRALSDRSSQLANYLQSLGVQPETRVGLCMDRSPELIVGILGILKSGAAFVPLDPDYPKQRLSFMIEDARLEIILTQEDLAHRFDDNSSEDPDPKAPRSSSRTIVVLDRDWKKVAKESRAAPPNKTSPEDLAYVIYTSGSTGHPKGVMISHRALAACIEGVVGAYEIKPADRVLQFASISFDASLEEIFGALTQGAALVLRDDSMIATPRELLRACGLTGVTVLDLPTAYWHQLTSALHDQEMKFPPGLRLVVIGGERALPDQLNAWIKLGPRDVLLMNSYGPTEATITATVASLVQAAVPVGEVPIGKPLGHVRALVLDGQLQPVPHGLAGELYLGGASVARGYLNRPDTTADRFVPNPYGPLGSRLYKTGDRVRRNHDGQLVYLGRLDHQVKVRGFRIELGDVEAAVVEHPSIRECVVVAQEDSSRNTELAAFAVAEGDETLSAGDLRRFLQQRLPTYMVPASIQIVETLPLTPADKVDRRALQASPMERSAEMHYVAPRTLVEQALTDMWKQLLKCEQVGVHDNFFELGGHSLLATQLVARIYQALGIHLPLRRLFETPTVADLALAVVEQKAEQAGEAKLNEILTELEEADPRLKSPNEQTS
jgi:amino acid adenylation domain-containing protein